MKDKGFLDFQNKVRSLNKIYSQQRQRGHRRNPTDFFTINTWKKNIEKQKVLTPFLENTFKKSNNNIININFSNIFVQHPVDLKFNSTRRQNCSCLEMNGQPDPSPLLNLVPPSSSNIPLRKLRS